MSRAMDNLREDLRLIMSDIEDISFELADALKTKGVDHIRGLQNKLSDLQSKADIIRERLGETTREGFKYVDGAIKENPYAGAVAAGLIGVALGYLLTKKCDR